MFYNRTSYFGGFGGGSSGPIGPAGPVGNPGPPGSGFNYRGAWTSTGSYAKNDAVSYQGGYYLAYAPNSNIAPPSLLIWDTISVSGLQGAAGSQGAAGPTGLPGPQGLPGADGISYDMGITGLTDVVLGSVSPGQMLKFNGSVWNNSGDLTTTGAGSSLSSLTDVNTSNVKDYKRLFYESENLFKYGSFPIWNVKDFGASGDDVTNDYQSILAAFRAMNNSGGTVYFPSAKYALYASGSTTQLGLINSAGSEFYYFPVSRQNANIVFDNDAELNWYQTRAYSGHTAGATITGLTMFHLSADEIRFVGGIWKRIIPDMSVVLTGLTDGLNNLQWIDGNSYKHLLKDIIASGGVFGLMSGPNEGHSFNQMNHNTYDNVTFRDWGPGEPDMNLYIQGGNLFRNCSFYQTYVSGGANKRHSHAIYTGTARHYNKFIGCRFENVARDFTSKFALNFYVSNATTDSQGCIIYDTSVINCFACQIQNSHYGTIYDHFYSDRPVDNTSDTHVGILDISSADGTRIINSRGLQGGFQGARYSICNNNYDCKFHNSNSASVYWMVNNNSCIDNRNFSSVRSLTAALVTFGLIANNQFWGTAAQQTLITLNNDSKHILVTNNKLRNQGAHGGGDFCTVVVNDAVSCYNYIHNNVIDMSGRPTEFCNYVRINGGTGAFIQNNVFSSILNTTTSLGDASTETFIQIAAGAVGNLVRNNYALRSRNIAMCHNSANDLWFIGNLCGFSGVINNGTLIYDLDNITGVNL